MTNTSPHTALPWSLGKGALTARNHAICAGPLIIAKVNGTGYGNAGMGYSPDSAADAAYIVTACNAYPALVEALANLVAADNCNYERDTMRYVGLFDAARAALVTVQA